MELDLLEEAKRRYPIGTKFFAAHISAPKECVIDHDAFFVDVDGYIKQKIKDIAGNRAAINDAGYWKCVYVNGKWAEITKLPEPVTKNFLIWN